MNRRELMLLLGGAMTVARDLNAQQKAMPVIGYLGSTSAGPAAPVVIAFRQGLSDAGYVEGQNVAIEFRWAEGHYDRFPALAAVLVERKVDVIAAGSAAAASAAKDATSTIPIVFVVADDPVEAGLVASLARPGGNLTGVNFLTVELMPKRLQLLSELVPQAKVIALLINPNSPTTHNEPLIAALDEAARAKGVRLAILKAGTENEIDAAFATLAQRQAGALIVSPDPIFGARREQLVALAARHVVPAIYFRREFAEIGGLMSYSSSLAVAYRLVGTYVGRILKGAKPADLPVQQPTNFELVVNLTTAKAAGPDGPALNPRPRRRGHRVNRRALMLLLAGAVTAARGVRAQQRTMPVIGWLGFSTDINARPGLLRGLRELGYIEGQNIRIEYRFPEERGVSFAGPIEDLGRLKVNIIVPVGFPATDAVHRAALTIPVVFVVADPIGSGFAESLAHPGGNMTGLSLAVEEQFSGKWLELLKEAAPQVSRVAYLWNPANHSSASSWKVMQGLAPKLGMTLQSVELRDPKELGDAFAAIIHDRAEGVIVDSDASMSPIQTRIVEFAFENRMPLISALRRFADAGGLITYGPNSRDLWRRAATYVDKILKGAKPADLPVERPTRFELVVNLNTAKALGLTIPPSILARADEVIE